MKTSDIYLAAAYLSLKCPLVDVDKSDTRHMEFEFARPGTEDASPVGTSYLADIEKAWANKSLMVNAFDFAEAMKRLKGIVHSK